MEGIHSHGVKDLSGVGRPNLSTSISMPIEPAMVFHVNIDQPHELAFVTEGGQSAFYDKMNHQSESPQKMRRFVS